MLQKMNQIIEILYRKRYCLPCDYNKSSNICNEENFCHIACIVGNGGNMLSYGINQPSKIRNFPGIHAEHNAILRLLPLRKKKQTRKIHLIVIRVSKTNKLQSSRPCIHCITIMRQIPESRGYKIKTISYSDANGKMVKTTLSQLERKEPHYTKFYRRHLN
jgi:cytidine deaminase